MHSQGQAWEGELLPAATLPAPTPGIQEERGASREREARPAVGFENLQPFIFVPSGGKQERTSLEESLKNISALGLFGGEEWRGGGSEQLEKVEFCLSGLYLLMNSLVLLLQGLSTLQAAARDSREPSPGLWQPGVPACGVGIALSEAHPWNKGALVFTSRP